MNTRSLFLALTAILVLLPSSLNAAAPGDHVSMYLTLTMKAQCDANIQGYRSKAEAGYVTWRQKHAEVIAEVEATRPLGAGSVIAPHEMPQLRSVCAALLEQFLGEERSPDERLSTPEKTWALFLTALLAADKETLTLCFDPSGSQFRDIVLEMRPEQQIRFANDFKKLHIPPSTADKFQEAVILRSDGRRGTVLFVKSREGWRIAQL